MNSPTLFRTVPSQTSYGLLFPKIGVRNPTQNPNIAIISGVGEVTAYGLQIWLEHSQGISEHKPVGIFSDCPDFWVPPIISGTGKATNFKFCTHIHSFIRKSTLKISGKVPVGVVRDSRKFSAHSHMGRIARSSLRQLSFLVFLFARCRCVGALATTATAHELQSFSISYIVELSVHRNEQCQFTVEVGQKYTTHNYYFKIIKFPPKENTETLTENGPPYYSKILQTGISKFQSIYVNIKSCPHWRLQAQSESRISTRRKRRHRQLCRRIRRLSAIDYSRRLPVH